MYEEYFGLNRPPFRITPDTSLFYEGGRRGDILAALAYAVQRGEGIVKVVGEVGSGKTMLCRMLQQILPQDVEIIYIANPSVSPEDILFVIASELHFDIDRDASKHELVAQLQNYLLKRHAEDRQVVLFIEEAQGMPLETLEEIRLLSNLETDQHKLLQIILFGQPELDENLSKKSIRQLRERITHEFKLAPLDAEEIHRYLNFRMREVGYTGPELINRKLAKQIAHHSEGLLRRVNILADKMLLAAYASDTHTLTSKHLREAVEDSGFTRLGIERSRHGPLFWSLLGLILLLIALLTIYKLQPQWLGLASPVTGPVAAVAPAENQSVATTNRQGNPARAEPVPQAVDSPLSPGNEPAPQNNAFRSTKPDSRAEGASKKLSGDSPDESEAARPGTASLEEMPAGSKKNALRGDKLDKVNANQAVVPGTSRDTSSAPVAAPDAIAGATRTAGPESQAPQGWLQKKLEQSRAWLEQADRQGVSIQVMVRNRAAAQELENYLLREWPLDLDKTYLFEVSKPSGDIFRVFYGEYPTITAGQQAVRELPPAIQVNQPYLHSIYRMQQVLLQGRRKAAGMEGRVGAKTPAGRREPPRPDGQAGIA